MSVYEFAFPFSIQGNDAAMVEQGSPEEITQAVGVLLQTPIGTREVLPSYGVPDILFGQQPLPMNDILAAINRWEPRAAVTLTDDPNQLDAKVVDIIASVTPRS